jgi:hypothetical protein
MDEESILYLAATLAIVAMVIFSLGNYGPFAILVAIMAILAAAAIIILNFADFLIFPAFTYILGIQTIPAKDYYIPKSQNCIIKNVNGLYYATAYLTANIYNYVFTAERAESSNDDSSLIAGPEKWEKIVMNTGFPFKFHLISSAEDIQKYREEIEGKRGLLEFQISKEMQQSLPKQMVIDDLQRRINIMQARLDRLSTGERPVNVLMYIETVAVGVSEKEAMDNISNQINQLSTIFNSFDLSMTRITGRELYVLFRYNFALPTSKEDITKDISTQS